MVSADMFIYTLALLSLLALIVGMIFRYFKQPFAIGYIITGLILGPFGLKVITDTEIILHIGEIGVVFLLFFVGISIAPSEFINRWRIAIIGTIFEVILSVVVILPVGGLLNLDLWQMVLVGFIICHSSTAVVAKVLESTKEIDTEFGKNIMSLLVVQDLMIVPMIIIISFVSGEGVSKGIMALQVFGGILTFLFIIWLMRQKEVVLPFSDKFKGDPEMQVLFALVVSMGIASLGGLLHLTTALGAFIAGMFIASTRETRWVQSSLEPFMVLFMAIFFVSIGLLIDITFLMQNFFVVAFLLFLILFINSIVNALIFRWNGDSWRTSFYAGAILAHIGELSFLLATLGLANHLLTPYSYQLIIQVIALSLLIGYFWVKIFLRFVDQSEIFIRDTRKLTEHKQGYNYRPSYGKSNNSVLDAGNKLAEVVLDESGKIAVSVMGNDKKKIPHKLPLKLEKKK